MVLGHEQVVILHADCSDHLCCLSLLDLLFALVLGLSLILGVALVSTTDCRNVNVLFLKEKTSLLPLMLKVILALLA